MCTVAKQVPSLRWWVAWGLTDCAQAPPPAAGASPGLGAAPRGVSHPSPCVSRRPELSFETHPAPVPALFLLVPSRFCLVTLSMTSELL